MTALVRLTCSAVNGLPWASWSSVRSGLGWPMWLRRMSRLGRSVTAFAASERGLERVAVVGDLAEVLDVPAVGLEALADVVAVGERGVAVDGDVVVVVDADQVAEAEVAGERRRLVADALHEAAVAGDDERVVVDHVGAEPGAQAPLGDGHADGVGEALAERPGRDLDAGGVADLGMAGRAPTPTGGTALMSSSSRP